MLEFFHKHTLRKEITLTLIIKLGLIILLQQMFFSGDKKVIITPEKVASHFVANNETGTYK